MFNPWLAMPHQLWFENEPSQNFNAPPVAELGLE